MFLRRLNISSPKLHSVSFNHLVHLYLIYYGLIMSIKCIRLFLIFAFKVSLIVFIILTVANSSVVSPLIEKQL